jgi:hypothetical protein
MKKLTLSAGLLLAAGLCMTSCKKEQSVVAEPGKAMITLHMGVNTNTTNDTLANGNAQIQYENVPVGTTVHFIMDSEELQAKTMGSYDYDMLTYTATVDANGDVMIELPAVNEQTADVTVKFPDLELDETSEVSTTSGGTTTISTKTEKKVYTKSEMTITVWDGAKLIKEDVNY